LSSSNPGFAVVFYCGAKLLAATLVSRFLTSTYQAIRLRSQIGPTSCFAKHFDTSPRNQQQNQGCSQSSKYRIVFLWLRFHAFRDLGPYFTFCRGLHFAKAAGGLVVLPPADNAPQQLAERTSFQPVPWAAADNF
jgi:hypothetical protein